MDADQRREERRLALHDGQARERADVAEAEHGRAVGHDGDRAAEARVLPGERRVPVDGEAHARDARRVDVAQHLLGGDRDRRFGPDLAPAVTVEHAVGLADETRDGQRVDAAVQAAVRLLVHLQRDFPQRAALFAAQRLEVVDGESRVRDHLQDPGEAAGLMHGLDDEDLGDLHARHGTRTVVGYAVNNRLGVST